MNKIEVIFNNQSKDLIIPLESSWDFYGQQEGVEKYEQSVLEQILNKDQDFEENQKWIDIYQKGQLVFQNVVVGQSAFSFCESSVKNAFHWGLFRSTFLHNSHIPTGKITKQQITIIIPSGAIARPIRMRH